MYYLHDKDALTAERVAWTLTLNLPTDDPEKAMKCMAWTATHADDLKRESGASMAGRKTDGGCVYCYSLSWHGEQQPDKPAMLSAATQTLERLGLSEHQTVIVAHADTKHPHVHVIVNLVHPDTGRIQSISHDKRRLSAWASEYEHNEGKIYCTQREENAARRQEGKITKYQDERLPEAPTLTELYRLCDTGKVFAAALEEAGYTLAQGDKGRLVIVDEQGKIQNLVRQIDGAKKKDIEAKLSDIDLSALPPAEEEAVRRKKQNEQQEEAASEVSHPSVAAMPPDAADTKEAHKTEQENPTLTDPYVQHAKPELLAEYRQEYTEKRREDRPAGVVQAVHLAAIASIRADHPAHLARTSNHNKRNETADGKKMPKQEMLPPMHCLAPSLPVKESSVLLHLKRTAAHMHRIGKFMLEKPFQYLEGLRRRSRHRIHEHERTLGHKRKNEGIER